MACCDCDDHDYCCRCSDPDVRAVSIVDDILDGSYDGEALDRGTVLPTLGSDESRAAAEAIVTVLKYENLI